MLCHLDPRERDYEGYGILCMVAHDSDRLLQLQWECAFMTIMRPKDSVGCGSVPDTGARQVSRTKAQARLQIPWALLLFGNPEA